MGNEPTIKESENRALVDALEKYNSAEILTLGEEGHEVDLLSTPAGGGRREIQSIKKFLDEYRNAPERREGTATLTTLASFCDYVKRFSDEHSIIFADVENRKDAKLIAVIDYNEKGYKGSPRFGKHRAVYRFPLADEWNAWAAMDGKEMNQAAFAQFIEDRILDVQAPAEAGPLVQDFAINLGGDLATMQRLKELSNGLSLRVDTAVTNSQNLSSGESTINFQETHGAEGGGPIKVPKGFAIAIPLFRGAELFSMPVRLRYRKHDGRILWTLLLYRVERIWEVAITEACDTAHTDTGRDLLYGKPEQLEK